MKIWGEKPENCWQSIGKKLFNPEEDWGKKLIEKSDMRELTSSINAKIAQFLVRM